MQEMHRLKEKGKEKEGSTNGQSRKEQPREAL